ncbi:MAG: divalent metal cation transporter [Rickettsiales bacterium]|nr:divalent metal cation transporter [Rickettsiales bacterium]
MKLKLFINSLGPGILLAATAIGVSHLVQSVQAGAKYGFLFIAVILFAHFLKYPFFEIAPRYSSVKKQSILHGYYDLKPYYLHIYLIITLISLVSLLSAVTVVAAGIFANIFDFNLSIKFYSIIVILTCYFILIFGKYNLLDRWVKYVIIFLTLSSVITLIISLINFDLFSNIEHEKFSFSNHLDLIFILGFIGWMPCPLDCSIWNSIWIVEKEHANHDEVNYKKSITDFRIGYFTTAFLAIIFLLIGKIMFYNSGEALPGKSIDFVAALLNAYSNNIGSWSFYIIAITAFITMFSTVITCVDGYPRSIAKTIKLIFYSDKSKKCNESKIYFYSLSFAVFATILTIIYLVNNMKELVIIATMLSFLTTPIIAYLNLQLVVDKKFPKKYRPHKFFIYYSIIAIIIMSFLIILYINSRFF